MSVLSTFISCRDNPDYLYSIFNELSNSDTTYEGQFKAFWIFMDSNYPMWDYEKEYGVDWDAIYGEYLSKFTELDKTSSKKNDDKSQKYYIDILTLLHDGHTHIKFKNRLLPLYPLHEKNKNMFVDFDMPRQLPNYDRYEYQNKYRIIEKSSSGEFAKFSENIIYFRPKESVETDYYMDNNKAGLIWKEWYLQIENIYNNNDLKGIIVDLRDFAGGNSDNFHYLFGFLQPVFLFSSQKHSYHQCGKVRYKCGLGRYDYSPLVPCLYKADTTFQLNLINVPIVVLSDMTTRSLGELICLAAKRLNNGYVIGTRTYGALNPLEDSIHVDDYALQPSTELRNSNYWIKIPCGTFYTDNGEILEGKGVTPDIEIGFDWDEYKATGRDNQLECAIEFILSK